MDAWTSLVSEKRTTVTQEKYVRERTCAGVQCTVRRKEKHDTCMNDLFWGRNSNLCQCTRAFVLRDLCSQCTCEHVACGRCICLHLQDPETSSVLARISSHTS